jgi:YhcG PDDEXK nuclease domain
LCEASHNIGKMQFYLSVLDDTVRLPEEQPSIGIILCKSKDRLIVEYALKDAIPSGLNADVQIAAPT